MAHPRWRHASSRPHPDGDSTTTKPRSTIGNAIRRSLLACRCNCEGFDRVSTVAKDPLRQRRDGTSEMVGARDTLRILVMSQTWRSRWTSWSRLATSKEQNFRRIEDGESCCSKRTVRKLRPRTRPQEHGRKRLEQKSTEVETSAPKEARCMDTRAKDVHICGPTHTKTTQRKELVEVEDVKTEHWQGACGLS